MDAIRHAEMNAARLMELEAEMRAVKAACNFDVSLEASVESTIRRMYHENLRYRESDELLRGLYSAAYFQGFRGPIVTRVSEFINRCNKDPIK